MKKRDGNIDDEMRAVVIDRFGGPEVLSIKTVPTPEPEPEQILIRVESAGLGIWDAGERQGMVAQMLGIKATFPWILGSEGAGKVVAIGDRVNKFRVGDSVYGIAWATNPKAGFFAEYKTLGSDWASPVPSNLSMGEAGALMIDGVVAFRGIDDILRVKSGEKLMIFGASGGIGHLAIQFGTRIGAHVFAVSSGEDGAALARRLGAEDAVDGHSADIVAAARKFAPTGFDAALFAAGGEAADRAVTTLRDGGRIAHPFGLSLSRVPSSVRELSYSESTYWNKPDHETMSNLNRQIEAGPFEVHLGGTFSLDHVQDAFRALDSHYLGRLAILPDK